MKTKLLFSITHLSRLLLKLARLPILLTLSLFLFSPCTAQVPQGINYQAVARGADGKELLNKTFQVRISILTDTTNFYATGGLPGYYLWEEQQTVTTSSIGLFTLAIGDTLKSIKIQGSAAKFSAINWTGQKLFIGIKINYPVPPGTFKQMGSAKLWSVPYALVSSKADSAKFLTKGTKLAVVSGNDLDTNALFLVKRKDGQTVFAVYPDAVNIYVPRGSKSATKGGFAIGGFNSKLGPPNDYFRVTPDSVRIYIDNTPTPGKSATKGGFAIGGFNDAKGLLPNYYMNVTGANAVNTVESAAQILWYPNKEAFLAGNIHIGSVDSVGTNSTALGYKSIAKGNYSQAFGYKTMALGDYSTAIGKNAVVNKINSFAFGENANAINDESYAFGKGAVSEGFRSFAFGSAAIDTIGHTTGVTYAKGDYSFAVGQGSVSNGFGSFAIGLADTAGGDYSFSAGYKTSSKGIKSTALGYYTRSSGGLSTAMGMQTTASGNYSTAMGWNTIASGQNSTAIGSFTTASGNSSTAIGNSNNASGYGSTTMGLWTTASGSESTAMGYHTQAKGDQSTAMGLYTYANCYTCAVVGRGNDTTYMTSINGWLGNEALFVVGNGYPGSLSNALTVFKSGYTAIGNILPSQMLDVSGNARFRSIGSGAYVGAVNRTSDGTLTTATSDIRTKDNINTLSNSLNSVMNLRGISFTWKSEPQMGKRIGFIAQEVEEIIPELVFTNPADGLKGVNYAEMTAVLVEAMKEQQKEIESYKSENDDLKSQLQTLQEKVEQIEEMLAKSDNK